MCKCIVCGKKTNKVLFSQAMVKTYICSQKCLQEYFKPIGGVRIQRKLKEGKGLRKARRFLDSNSKILK